MSVRTAGLEPAISWPPTTRDTRLRHALSVRRAGTVHRNFRQLGNCGEPNAAERTVSDPCGSRTQPLRFERPTTSPDSPTSRMCAYFDREGQRIHEKSPMSHLTPGPGGIYPIRGPGVTSAKDVRAPRLPVARRHCLDHSDSRWDLDHKDVIVLLSRFLGGNRLGETYETVPFFFLSRLDAGNGQ